MKLLNSIFMFFILLISSLVLVSATSEVIFNEIEVNDVSVTDGGIVVIERGDDLDIRVELQSPVDYDDVRVKASIEGYEHDDIDDSTEIFDMEGSTGIYTKKLHLAVPSDIDVGDYSLNIEVVNPLGLKNMLGIVLQVREGRHNLGIQDVILRPSYSVEAGRPLGVEVRIENMGSRKEEDIKITASIPALGISARDYIDELGYEEENSDDDETSDSITLYLPIPVDAVSGEYDLHVNVEYNRDHDVVSTKTRVYVDGTSVISDIDTIISIDAVSKPVAKGDMVSYRLMLANLGQDEAIYSLDVSGTQYWADVSLNPGFVRVAPNGAGELNLMLKPKDAATTGDHTFTLKIKENDKTLRDITLTAVVGGKSSTSFKNVLEIGFAVLITLLVILGLIVAFKKLQERKESGSEPEPMIENNQSYY